MPLGVWGLGCCLGSLLSCWRSASFERLRWLYFEVVRISAKKARISKKCDVIQFLHIFIWEVKGWFRANFVIFSAVMSLSRSARAIYNAVFYWFPLFSYLGELSSVISACFPSSVAVLLVLSCGRWWCWVRPIPSSREKVGYICIYLSVTYN